MSRCPLYTFSVMLGSFMIIVFAVCILSAMQINFWNSLMMFELIHLCTVDSVLEVILYGSCAVV